MQQHSGPRTASVADEEHGQAVAAAAEAVTEAAEMDAGPTDVEMATAAQATAAAELVERGRRELADLQAASDASWYQAAIELAEAELQAALEQARQQLAEASVAAPATATATAAATQLELESATGCWTQRGQ